MDPICKDNHKVAVQWPYFRQYPIVDASCLLWNHIEALLNCISRLSLCISFKKVIKPEMSKWIETGLCGEQGEIDKYVDLLDNILEKSSSNQRQTNQFQHWRYHSNQSEIFSNHNQPTVFPQHSESEIVASIFQIRERLFKMKNIEEESFWLNFEVIKYWAKILFQGN